MAELDPAIHTFVAPARKTWITGTKPGDDEWRALVA
jgi:hypothetical protein